MEVAPEEGVVEEVVDSWVVEEVAEEVVDSWVVLGKLVDKLFAASKETPASQR